MSGALTGFAAGILAGAGLLWLPAGWPAWRARCGGRIELARLAHEVRGPLHSAMLVIDRLDGLKPTSPITAETCVGVARRELARAASALAAMTGAIAGDTPVDSDSHFDARAAVVDIAAPWRLIAAGRGRSVDLAWEPRQRVSLRGDRASLQGAVANLIANALEHGSGAVELRCRLRHGMLRVEVGDQGSGLDRPLGAIVAAERAGARGHGLAAAERAARRHGGRLVSAPAGAGGRIVLELPVDDAAPAFGVAYGSPPRARGAWPSRLIARS